MKAWKQASQVAEAAGCGLTGVTAEASSATCEDVTTAANKRTLLSLYTDW